VLFDDLPKSGARIHDILIGKKPAGIAPVLPGNPDFRPGEVYVMRRKMMMAVLQIGILLVLFVATACLPVPDRTSVPTGPDLPTTTAATGTTAATTPAATTASETGPATTGESSAATTTGAAPALIWSDKTSDRSFMAKDGTVVLTASCTLPHVVNASANPAGVPINAYMDQLAADALEANQTMASDAVSAYENNPADFFQWTDDIGGEIVWQTSRYASVVIDQTDYLGGAHPNTLRSSVTFDLDTGDGVPLAEFFTISESQMIDLLVDLVFEQASSLVDESGVLLYDCDEATIRAAFRTEQYYLSEIGLTLYFQPYDIAPYAAGLPEFVIPYDQLSDVTRNLD
jgi:hypothetical protein